MIFTSRWPAQGVALACGLRSSQGTSLWRPPRVDAEPVLTNYTIFEGTSEIQRLIIARAIVGLHIQ